MGAQDLIPVIFQSAPNSKIPKPDPILGPFARERRHEHGRGKPETFTLLGFTHVCGRSRRGRFQVVRRTMALRLRAKLAEIKAELRRRRH